MDTIMNFMDVTFKPKTAYLWGNYGKYPFNYIINKLYEWINTVCMLGYKI